MEKRGTWILPYKAAKIPSLWEDFVSALAEKTTYLRDEDDQPDEEETPSGKIAWELRCNRAGDGWEVFGKFLSVSILSRCGLASLRFSAVIPKVMYFLL